MTSAEMALRLKMIAQQLEQNQNNYNFLGNSADELWLIRKNLLTMLTELDKVSA